jgi:[NiFe] hydrogenase diaphorase moiety large subunit
MVFEGMIIAGYAVGATQGILYVRHEYRYLERWLESVLDGARRKHYLGKNIAGREGFDFDIRIQFGAGAYVCGEESALIESAEGKRGEPRDRPPFPVEKGYRDKPTVVNNVETFCATVKIVLNGGEWYRSFGTKDSTGTKLLSISGDCMHPGVYEIEWGFSVNDVLDMVGGYDPQAVQVGGPSGSLIGPDEFDRTLSFSDLSTGGSLIIFGKQRDLLKDVVMNFLEFFIEESCGACTPCRVIPVLLRQKLDRIIAGRGIMKDLNDMVAWSRIMKANRCGLGQTAANPVTSSVKNFRHLYIERLHQDKDYEIGFDLARAIQDGAYAANRKPVLTEASHE